MILFLYYDILKRTDRTLSYPNASYSPSKLLAAMARLYSTD